MKLKITGYAAVFDIKDRKGDVLDANCFKINAIPIKVFLGHNLQYPIGKTTQSLIDQKGLWVEIQLQLPESIMKDVVFALRKKYIEHLSIGFITKNSYLDSKTGIRHVLLAELIEISLVTIPCNPLAMIDEICFATD
jgi:HK97 family phage prohead protease